MEKIKKYFEFKQPGKNENTTELFIYGDITSWPWSESDVGAFNLAKEISMVETDLVVRINSYGGEVAEGLAIYNLLKTFKNKVTTVCDGFACSAASIIFMSGSERVMNEGSLLMIHNAWTCASGDSNDLRKQAEDLEKITQPSVKIYESNSKLTEEKIKEMMDAETWITSMEALDFGFATKINEVQSQQSIDKRHLAKQVMKTKDLEQEMNILKQAQKPIKGWDAFFNS